MWGRDIVRDEMLYDEMAIEYFVFASFMKHKIQYYSNVSNIIYIMSCSTTLMDSQFCKKALEQNNLNSSS